MFREDLRTLDWAQWCEELLGRVKSDIRNTITSSNSHYNQITLLLSLNICKHYIFQTWENFDQSFHDTSHFKTGDLISNLLILYYSLQIGKIL